MAAAGKLDPYAVLGVARSASAAEIRAAYRALGAREAAVVGLATALIPRPLNLDL